MLLEEHQNGALLAVRVVPRSSKTSIEGVVDDALRVRLAAPPVDGAANAALIELIARECGIPKSRVTIVSGDRAKRKRLLLRGVGVTEVRDRLGLSER